MISQHMQSLIFPSIQVLYLLIKTRTGKRELCYPQILKVPKPGGTQYLLGPPQISQVKMTSILHMCESNKNSTFRADYGPWAAEDDHVCSLH